MAEVSSDAVMLHNGVKKLGNVVDSQMMAVRKLLAEAAAEHGQDQVIVVWLDPLSSLFSDNLRTFNHGLPRHVNVQGVGMVHERVARKHAKQQSQKG